MSTTTNTTASLSTSETLPDSMHRLLTPILVTTVSFGVLMLLVAWNAQLPLRDPDGLLGPSYVRLPLIALSMILLDLIPRTLLHKRQTKTALGAALHQVATVRLSRVRLLGITGGLMAFYISYVAYRNLKSFLPFVNQNLHDQLLNTTDVWLTGGTQPGDLLHTLLGTGISADILSFTYMIFLPFVPISLALALVWSNNLARGAWYAAALSWNWILGTLSYYVLPALGPIYAQPQRFLDLPVTAVTGLQGSLWDNRMEVLAGPHITDAVHGIAAFGSLHTSIVFTAALIATLCILPRLVRIALWVFCALTILATIYFGWHYLLDVVAGLIIGGISVYLGALLTGHQKTMLRVVNEKTVLPV